MNELESILNYLETTSLEPHNDYTSEFTYKDQKILWNYIKQLQQKLQQKEDIINKIKKCIEEKEEYYGDYMGDGNYTMYSMMGANNNRIPYIKSNLIKQILDNKGDENDG